MNYSLGNMLGRGRASKITISGFAYPLETLTASRAGQWSIDGVPVIGQTAATFQVPLLAYGRTITCDNSAPVVVWKPWDIAGVVSVRVADRGVLRGVSPDVVAVNGDTIRRWNGLVSNQPADQTNSAFQPIWRSAGQSGNPSLEFDGADDRLDLSGAELQIYSNVSISGVIAGARATNHAGGNNNQLLYSYNFPGIAQTQMVLAVRSGSDFAGFIRRVVNGAELTITSPNNGNYNVLGLEANYAGNLGALRVNASQVASGSIAGTGNTPTGSSNRSQIGSQNNANTAAMQLCCLINYNQALSATNRSRLERFAGLFGGLNIPLV